LFDIYAANGDIAVQLGYNLASSFGDGTSFWNVGNSTRFAINPVGSLVGLGQDQLAWYSTTNIMPGSLTANLDTSLCRASAGVLEIASSTTCNAGGSLDLQTLNMGGLVAQYNGISTVDNGVPSVLGHSNLTGQTAAQSGVSLYTPAATGMFRVTYYAKVTTAGTSSILGGATGFVLAYTDGTDSVAQTLTLTAANQAGSLLTIGTGNITNTTGTISYGTATVYAKTGVPMTYSFGYSSTGTTMQYEIHVKVEAL
jgi:hypothetical protein